MFEDLKQAALDANLALKDSGLVILTWGNASAIDRKRGVVAIKPSGVAYDKLDLDSIVVVDMEGNVIEGALRPSSDTQTHLSIYRRFPEVGGVVHTHSTYAVAWAQAGKAIPNIGTTHSDTFHADVPCTREMTAEEIAGGYELYTGDLLAECFGGINPMHTPGALVRHHGPFTWGRTAAEAVENAVILEEVAHMAYLTFAINPGATMNPLIIDKHYYRKHGKNASYGQIPTPGEE